MPVRNERDEKAAGPDRGIFGSQCAQDSREPRMQSVRPSLPCYCTGPLEKYERTVGWCGNGNPYWTAGSMARPLRNVTAGLEARAPCDPVVFQAYKDSEDDVAPEETYAIKFCDAPEKPEGAKETRLDEAGCPDDEDLARDASANEDVVTLMQMKRGRATTPRRRRRDRAYREETRERQERRHSWTVNASTRQASTETCSRRPLVPPWHKGKGKGKTRETSRPSSAPTSAPGPATAGSTTAAGSVPDIPPLGEGSANIVWWSEIVGLQDPMQENDRVLDDQTIEAIVDNLRNMSPARRTAMVAQIVPFLGAFLAEILRAINLAQQPHPEEPELIEEDDTALLQVEAFVNEGTEVMEEDEVISYMQKFDPTIPFGSKLCQLQGHLNGFDKEQCAQVACHMRTMTQRLRTLAGVTSALVSDRFLRLEALIATYHTGETEVPLSLQIWTEGQLRALVPYLNGGRTPESLDSEARAMGQSLECSTHTGSDAAAASTDLVHVADSQDLEPTTVPDYRVRRSADGPWEPASAQEAAEFRAHDEALEADRRAQEEADRVAYSQHEASMAQQWDDWAVASELNNTKPPPSRKRVRITICAGTGNGQSIGEACIEGVIAHDQQATISFNVVEALVGGLGQPALGAVNSHADPQLAGYERDHLPGLPEMVQDFLCSLEGRHWLWRLQEGTANVDMMVQRFGQEIAEAAQLWLALQEDLDKGVRNLADGTATVAVGTEGSTSGSSTVAVDNGDEGASSLTGPAVAHIGAAGEDQEKEASERQDGQSHGEGEEEAMCSEAADVDVMDCDGNEGAERDGREGQTIHDTVPDSLQLAGGMEDDRGQNVPGANVEGDESNHECGVEGTEVAMNAVDMNAAEVDVNHDEREPYDVPLEWHRILRAWDDPAIGAGLEDSALSTGEFERPFTHGVGSAVEPGAAGPAVDGEPPESSTSSRTGMTRSTEGSESGSGAKQTDLKGWLK